MPSTRTSTHTNNLIIQMRPIYREHINNLNDCWFNYLVSRWAKWYKRSWVKSRRICKYGSHNTRPLTIIHTRPWNLLSLSDDWLKEICEAAFSQKQKRILKMFENNRTKAIFSLLMQWLREHCWGFRFVTLIDKRLLRHPPFTSRKYST